jgi:hypothetical protein
MPHTMQIDNQQKIYHNNNMKILDTIKNNLKERLECLDDTARHINKHKLYSDDVMKILIKSYLYKKRFYTTPC